MEVDHGYCTPHPFTLGGRALPYTIVRPFCRCDAPQETPPDGKSRQTGLVSREAGDRAIINCSRGRLLQTIVRFAQTRCVARPLGCAPQPHGKRGRTTTRWIAQLIEI